MYLKLGNEKRSCLAIFFLYLSRAVVFQHVMLLDEEKRFANTLAPCNQITVYYCIVSQAEIK